MANYLVLITFLTIPHIRGEDKQERLISTTVSPSNDHNDPNRMWQWNEEVKHDPAGGVFRVSGDGPKPRIADPLLDIGSGGGKDLLLTAEQVQSHPNYKYLSPLSECGRMGRVKTPKKYSLLVDLDDYNEDLVGGKDDMGIDSESDEEHRIKRIVGGKSTTMRKHPWVAQLYTVHTSTGKHLFQCSGTIISNSTILTAAHCITRTPSGSSLEVVVVGTEDRKKIKFCKTPDPAENCSREAIKLIGGVEVHWNYSEGNLNHDIGLIYLKKPLRFSEHVRPICLPQSKTLLESWPSLKLTVVGWGSVNKYIEGINSALLKEVEQDLQSRSLCDMFHTRIYGRTLDHRICTGGHPEKASCNGDSGGVLEKSLKIPDPTSRNTTSEAPVMMIERVFQFGIVSAGGHVVDTCGFQGRPTIDTNVIFYMDWILNHIVQGSQAYRLLKPGGSPVNSSLWLKVKSRMGNESEYNYKNEFSTGENVDVSKHPNIHLLPSFNECGSMMTTPFQPTIGKSNLGPLDLFPPLPGGASSAWEEEEMKRKKRIVGGVPTKLQNYFPWMAQVYVRNVENDRVIIRCSGTIITARHILTAAHCVTEINAPYVFDKIIVGQYNRNTTQECVDGICYHPQEVKIADTIIHAEYEKYTQRNNLAIVRLSEDLQFTRMIQPICLPRREILLEGIRVHKYFTAGWGIVTREAIRNGYNQSAMLSELLLHINVNLRPRRDCDYVYSRAIDLLGRSRLCGGGKAARGECGDGGSPLMKKLETKNDHVLQNKILQLGIVTFTDCGMEGMPTIYMNVMFYMEWILNNLILDNV